ncbi:hypothetical protein, partial [Chromobacterium haemolyticum]|uniref:hypothetical protein n=1 Tax=Chromobacterium haemolyticum TaxID=394935 RepID=UPI001C390FDD
KHAASVQSEPGSNSSVQFQANFLARKIKETSRYLSSCSASVWSSTEHLHLSVIRFVKERCRSLRFVSAAALSAEEANYTSPP